MCISAITETAKRFDATNDVSVKNILLDELSVYITQLKEKEKTAEYLEAKQKRQSFPLI